MSATASPSRLRIGFFGNVCNNFYQVASALREHSDIEAHLYLDTKHDHQMLPESDNPALKDNYPPWIHKRRFLGKGPYLRPWRAELTRELAQYDIVMVSSNGPVFSQFTSRPVCFYVTGGDLTVMPFPLDKSPLSGDLRYRIGELIGSVWQRRGIRRATEIWTQPFSPFVDALERLQVEEARIKPLYFPLILDSATFAFDGQARHTADEGMRRIAQERKFILFHPSRLMMNDHPHLKAKGQWKRNDLLLEGYAKFLARTGAKDAALVLLDRSASTEIERAKAIIERLGIGEHVFWLKAPRALGFTRAEMIKLYSLADVVADDFGIGWFGSVVLEGLSISRPVISYVDEAVMDQLYPWHPILSPRTADEVGNHLALLYTQPSYRSAVGQKGREWIEQFHAPQSASQLYVEQICQLAERLGLPRPRFKEGVVAQGA